MVTGARDVLVRGRLLDLLDGRWLRPVTVMFAPAGYGKTTLLTQAVAANTPTPVGIDCVLTCGPDHAIASVLGEAICRAVDASVAVCSGGDPDQIAAAVADAMWRRSPRQVTLLLDDVHEVPAGSDGARLLDAVVTALPANGHLVLAGRTRPPVPIARLDVEDQVTWIEQADLAFTPAELDQFAVRRGVDLATLTASDGWPALAELLARARPEVIDEYVGQEVLRDLSAAQRRALALLADIGMFGEDVAATVVGPGINVAGLLAAVPLVSRQDGGSWSVHALWRTWLASVVSPADLAEARRRAGVTLLGQSETSRAVRLLIDAQAWDELANAISAAIGASHPPVAIDMVRDWAARLPRHARALPGGRLLDAVLTVETAPDDARQRFEACAADFRGSGLVDCEITCLLQLGHMAWWSEQPERLVPVVARLFELEAAGCEEAVAFACLGRAHLLDLHADSRGALAELDRIPPGSVSGAWQAMIEWARAVSLLQLGHVVAAGEAAERALEQASDRAPPFAETTRLHALWYQGRHSEVLAALPALVEQSHSSGYRNHLVLVLTQCAGVHALLGDAEQAASYLTRAEATALGVPDAPLLDTNLSLADAAVSVARGDEQAAIDGLAAYLARHVIGAGISVSAQRRHLALTYVLIPACRPVWEATELGPAFQVGRDLARAVVAVRDDGGLPPDTPPLPPPAVVQAHLPTRWIAELGVAAAAAGCDVHDLLDHTWSRTRPVVAELAHEGRRELRPAALDTLTQLAKRPTARLRLRVLGPIALSEEGNPVATAEWRRERVRSLLAYLAVHRTVSRRQAGDDLWPRLDTDAQARNLRVTLTYLRRVLEPHRGRGEPAFFVRHDGDLLILHPGDWMRVDLWEFDELCDQVAEADRQDQPAQALDHALRAIELWRGEPTELRRDAWAVEAFEVRRARLARVCARAGELLLAHRDPVRALALAAQALTLDPWLEPAHRLLLATHHACGDLVAAQRALDRYRHAIEDLGITPDEATLMVARLLQLSSKLLAD